MSLINILLILLAVGAVIFGIFFFRDYRQAKKRGEIETAGNIWTISLTGFFSCLLDTLGIGSFAPMTAIFKHFHLVKDRIIPGTLNTAMCIPTIAEALIFIRVVRVEAVTLISMIIAAIVGALIGASVVVKLDERKVQFGIASAMTVVLLLLLAEKLGLFPIGGTFIGLSGMKLIIAIIGNFILGGLMMIGVGLYAPCMALIYVLGLNPIAAFPIMMGSSAFIMPTAGIRFIKSGAYNRRCTLIIAITGVFGVIIAAYFVKSLPLHMLTWLIIGVIGFTAVRLFLSALSRPNK